MAILDSKLRVRGTDGLRVIDANVFPKIPGAFPVVPTTIARNGSEAILDREDS
jgi:choline dehydrogenase